MVAGVLIVLSLFGSFEYISYSQTTASFAGARFTGVTFVKPNPGTLISDAFKAYSLATSPSAETFAEGVAGVIGEIDLNITFTFHNAGILPVSITGESHQIYLAGALLSVGGSPGFSIPAGGSVSVTFRESIQTTSLVDVVRSAILSGGQVRYAITGSAGLVLGSVPISVEGQVDLFSYLAQQAGITLPR
jgi:hypothetical protein